MCVCVCVCVYCTKKARLEDNMKTFVDFFTPFLLSGSHQSRS